MTIPVGRAHDTDTTTSVLGAPASLIGSELSSLLGSDPSICLALMPQGYLCAELHRMGERPTYTPPSPSLRLSKHRPSVTKSSIWARKRSLIWGMCSGPPRDYNLNNRQAGCPLPLPLPEQPGFSLASGGSPGPSGTARCRLLRLRDLRHYGVLRSSHGCGQSPMPGEYCLAVAVALRW
jgi:hypothetical protein